MKWAFLACFSFIFPINKEEKGIKNRKSSHFENPLKKRLPSKNCKMQTLFKYELGLNQPVWDVIWPSWTQSIVIFFSLKWNQNNLVQSCHVLYIIYEPYIEGNKMWKERTILGSEQLRSHFINLPITLDWIGTSYYHSRPYCKENRMWEKRNMLSSVGFWSYFIYSSLPIKRTVLLNVLFEKIWNIPIKRTVH